MYKATNVYKTIIEEIDGVSHYFVTFWDVHNNIHTIEIDKVIYEEFQKSKKIEKSQQNYFDRYIEHFDLSDEDLYKRSIDDLNLTDEIVFEKMYGNILIEALYSLSDIERRRFILYYEYDFTYAKIAKLENCSDMSIIRSVRRAKEKLYTALKKSINDF